MTDPAAGEPWLASVGATTQAGFDAVTPIVSPEFTFTSSEGTIPIVMGDPGPTPLRVTVVLDSSDFSFPDGNRQDVLVDRPGVRVDFRVEATTSGQNPIVIGVRAPNGTQITSTTVVVRTTTVNHIALLVTIGAGLGLLALYSRRWFRRRTNPA